MNIELIQKKNPWHQKVYFFEKISSTNTKTLELGEEGAPEGTIVIADEQTAGRGQFQRPWFSPKGAGIWMSLLLRTKITAEMIPALSRFPVLGLYDAISKTDSMIDGLKIKEPNDLFIREKKVAGVLTETRLGGSSFAVIGLGVNIFQQQDDFPIEFRESVTSLRIATRKSTEWDRSHLIILLLEALHKRYQQCLHDSQTLDIDWNLRKQSDFSSNIYSD